jgi:hypothetical protein
MGMLIGGQAYMSAGAILEYILIVGVEGWLQSAQLEMQARNCLAD